MHPGANSAGKRRATESSSLLAAATEAIPLSRLGRLFAMGLIVGGVGTAAYFITSTAHLLTVDVLGKLATGSSMQSASSR